MAGKTIHDESGLQVVETTSSALQTFWRECALKAFDHAHDIGLGKDDGLYDDDSEPVLIWQFCANIADKMCERCEQYFKE